MKKLIIAACFSSVMASPVFAAAVNYNGTAKSGTAANQAASISVVSSGTTNLYYVDPASGTASNKNAAAIQLTKTSNWSFDFADPAHVTFTGSIVYGNYAVQSNITAPITADGRQSFYGVTQSFSGVGSFDQATNTFTYNFSETRPDYAGGSVYSQTAAPVCKDGATFFGQGVCSNFGTHEGALDWEGLALNFVFSADRSSFTGSLVGKTISGTGAFASTTTYNWQIAGAGSAPAVPVPAAAWLFGSGLLGLAGAARRRIK